MVTARELCCAAESRYSGFKLQIFLLSNVSPPESYPKNDNFIFPTGKINIQQPFHIITFA